MSVPERGGIRKSGWVATLKALNGLKLSEHPEPFPASHLLTWATHRPLGSSFFGITYRILNINHKKDYLQWGLWVYHAPQLHRSTDRGRRRKLNATGAPLKPWCECESRIP